MSAPRRYHPYHPYHPYHHYPSPSYTYPMDSPYFPPPPALMQHPPDHSQTSNLLPPTSPPHSPFSQQIAESCPPVPQSQAEVSSASQRSRASASIPVSSYRPERRPVSSARTSASPDSQPRSAADIYAESRQPKTTAGNQILATLAGMTAQLTKLQEEIAASKFEQSALSTDLTALKNDNRQLRDQIHELQLGQRSLATREEIAEEVSQQLSSAFTEHFHALSDKLEKALVDRLDLVNRPSQRPPAGAIEGYDDDKMSLPLISLLNHLISKLDHLDEISAVAQSLNNLPALLRDVAVFKQALDELNAKATRTPPASACIIPPTSPPDESTSKVIGDTTLHHLPDPESITTFHAAVAKIFSALDTKLDRLATKHEQANLVDMIKAIDARLTQDSSKKQIAHTVMLTAQIVAALARMESLLAQLHTPHAVSCQPTLQLSEKHQPMTPVSLKSTDTPVTDSHRPEPTSNGHTPANVESIGRKPLSSNATATPTNVIGPLNYLPSVQTSTSSEPITSSTVEVFEELAQEPTQTDSLGSVTSPSKTPEQGRAKKKVKRNASLDLRPITRSMSNENRSKSLSTGKGASNENAIEVTSSSSVSSTSSDGKSNSLASLAAPATKEIAQTVMDQSFKHGTTGSATSNQKPTSRAASASSQKSTSTQRSQSIDDRSPRNYSASRELAKRLETASRSKRSSPATVTPRGGHWGKKRFLELGDDSDEDDGGLRGDEMSLLSA